MTLINIHNLHKSYGDKQILAGASLQIYSGNKVGLVGANGSGKTTLLKIINREETTDEGQVSLAKDLTLGYLSQKPGILPKTTLEDYLKEALQDLYILKDELSQLEREMALPHIAEDKNTLQTLMEKYGSLTHRFEALDGYNLDNRLRGVARGLGFTEEELTHRISEFSGGEKTRVQLASLLLREYDLLLLDEPTNNLDTEAMEWLENYLNNWRGALLVVSHDRYFLDRVVNKIAFLNNKIIKVYPGNYTSFTAQRQLEQVAEEKSFKKQQQMIQKDLDFIRNASSEEIKRAQSRMKRVEKMKPIEETRKAKNMKPRFGYAGRASNIVLAFDGVSKAFSGNEILDNVTMELYWGDRIAVVGPNGAGKTTILRMITGEIAPDRGKIKLGPSVKMAYYDQEQKQLSLSSTILENIMDASKMTESEARNYLGGYLFRGDDVFKKANTLSSGEKSRLALAKTTLSDSNFLVLDEPTNYLDIGAMEQLEKSLSEYPGTLMIVSHDRFFISSLANVILEVSDKQVKLYRAPYREYVETKEHEKEKATSSLTDEKKETKMLRMEQREQDKKERRELMARRRERQNIIETLAELEERIHNEEDIKTSLEKKLAVPGIYDDFNNARAIMDQLNDTGDTIKNLYAQWEETAEKLEQLPPEDSNP